METRRPHARFHQGTKVLFALPVSVVLAIVVGQVIGLLSFGIPLALDVS